MLIPNFIPTQLFVVTESVTNPSIPEIVVSFVLIIDTVVSI